MAEGPGPLESESAEYPAFRSRHLIRRWIESTGSRVLGTSERSWRYSLAGAANLARLSALRNRHFGRRCFIVGNGPSLREMDLTPLRGEFIIGTNLIHLHPECVRWSRWYYCCVNPHVIAQSREAIAGLGVVKFLPWEERGRLGRVSGSLWVRTLHRPGFCMDLTEPLWQGGTVTYVALQTAFHLGFTEVVLIGVDHHYERAGQPNKLVVSEGADPDHFSPAYFGPGFRWQLPDLEQSETAYRLARQAFEQEGRRVRDATVGGRLTVFPRVRFEDLF